MILASKRFQLYTGNENDFMDYFGSDDVALINLASTVHSKILGYKPDKSSEQYVLYFDVKNNIASANFVDSLDPKYFDYMGNGQQVFTKLLDFLEERHDIKTLISCNLGMSRSNALAMLYMSKRTKEISDDFEKAIEEFKVIVPFFNPSLGIYLYLKNNWAYIN